LHEIVKYVHMQQRQKEWKENWREEMQGRAGREKA
jgi:hypothetical protein